MNEPTAVKIDPADQKITEQGQTETDSEQANKQYGKKWMIKTGSNDS